MKSEFLKKRKKWLSILSQSDYGQLSSLYSDLKLADKYEWIKKPEHASVMVRGRIGGIGSQFNFGEITITKCVLLLNECMGYGYVQGRSFDKAKIAALCDDHLQSSHYNLVMENIIQKLEKKKNAEIDLIKNQMASTRVDFFALDTQRTKNQKADK